MGPHEEELNRAALEKQFDALGQEGWDSCGC
jgi:hypothetical protein